MFAQATDYLSIIQIVQPFSTGRAQSIRSAQRLSGTPCKLNVLKIVTRWRCAILLNTKIRCHASTKISIHCPMFHQKMLNTMEVLYLWPTTVRIYKSLHGVVKMSLFVAHSANMKTIIQVSRHTANKIQRIDLIHFILLQ